MVTSDSAQERRRPDDPRVPLHVPFVAESPAIPDQRGTGTCLDLSQKGAGIRLGNSLRLGSAIRVTLQVCAVPLLRLEGRVAWVQKGSDASTWVMGVEFDGELPGELIAEIAGAEPSAST
jgi:hypothetical protein